MKILSAIAKIVAALAFIAGVVYLVATYGDKIVAWAKKLLPCKDCACEKAAEPEEDIAEPVEEPAEAPAEDAVQADEEAPVAEEADFEG